MFSTDIVEVRLPLTDSQLTELNLPIGFMAESENAPTVELSAIVGNQRFSWEGQIVRTNASIDQQTRLIYAIAEVSSPYQAESPLAVGLYVNAEMNRSKGDREFKIANLFYIFM